jgi:hypothetical protein
MLLGKLLYVARLPNLVNQPVVNALGLTCE